MTAYRSVPNGDITWLARDRERLRQLAVEEGRDPTQIVHSHQDHMYIRMDGSRRAIESAVRQFTFKSFDDIEPYYLLGTPDEIISKLRKRVEAGIQEIAINFIDPAPVQLELFAQHILPHFRNGT